MCGRVTQRNGELPGLVTVIGGAFGWLNAQG
jgi:hypothetical protein